MQLCPLIASRCGTSETSNKKGIEYLLSNSNGKEFRADEAVGRIDDNEITVDGNLIEYEEFIQMLTVYSGFNIEFTMKDQSE